MFDAFTGQPLQPMYDQYTGLPLAGVSTVQAEDAVTVHPTANGGLHDGTTGSLVERLQALEDRVTALEEEEFGVKADSWPPEVKPSGTADTSSLKATGGVNGGEPAEQSLLQSATVPTNDPTAPELSTPTGAPAFTDERNEMPISTSGPAFEPENTEDVGK